MMKRLLIILLLAMPLLAMAQEDNSRWAERQDSIGKVLYDSVMNIEVRRDMLKDSTEVDMLKRELFDAILAKNKWLLSGSEADKSSAATLINNLLEKLAPNNAAGVSGHPYLYAEALYQNSELLFRDNQISVAYAYMVEAVKNCPDNVKYLERLAGLCDMSSNKEIIDKGADCYRKLVKINPKNRNVANYHIQLARIYAIQGNAKKAIREVEEYEKTEGSSLQTLSYKTGVYAAFKKDKEAIKLFDKYVEENPIDHYEARLMELEYLRDREIWAEYEKLTESMRKEYPTDATLMINQAIYSARVKNDFKSYAECVDGLIESGNMDDVFDESIVNRLVAYRLEQKDTAAVYATMQKIERLYSENETMVKYTGKVYNTIGDSTSLRHSVKRLVEIAPENSDYMQEMLLLYNAEHMNDSVRITAKAGYERFGNDQWKYMYLISLAMDSAYAGEFIERGKVIIPTISESGIKSHLYGTLGDAYSIKNMESERDAAYDSALVYNPDNAMVLNNMAYNMACKENVTEEEMAKAEHMAAKALKSQPNSSAVLDTYGWILFLRGDKISAKLYLDKCVKLIEEKGEKASVTEYYHLYEIYKSLDNPKAEKWLEKGKALLKENPDSTDEPKIKELFK